MHVDLDAFYSSIEQRDRPELRGKPVIVGGDPDGRGVVATASYEARRFGVHSAMPCRTARRLCPQGIFVRPRFDVYRQVSRELHELFQELTDLVEPIAFDEAYLDISSSASSPDSAEDVARALQRRILAETALTCSIGVAANKLVAKVASERRKPAGLTIVPAGAERAFLGPLPVRSLIGIGPRSEERLRGLGIETVAQLADADAQWIVANLGPGGFDWQRLARGIDDRPVEPNRPLKQVSREVTLSRDVAERTELHGVLGELAAELAPALASVPPARTLTLKFRYGDFSLVTRRRSPGSIVTAETLSGRALELFDESWDGRPLRLLGIGVSNFVTTPDGQLSLFDV
jgi:DNA polymerase-4